MISRKRIVLALSIIAIAFSSGFARNILEKKMFYMSNTNKQGQALYWVVYLGNYDPCTLTRKFPGEPEKKITASMNFQYLSSGYIEGNGYSEKGKISSLPTMLMVNANGERTITADSIDFIFDYGQKVTLVTGETGEFVIDVEGEKKSTKKFLMREYKLTISDGEKILKEGSVETPLAAFAYSKEGIARAAKAQAAIDASSGNQ
jgi:hypothetical protein